MIRPAMVQDGAASSSLCPSCGACYFAPKICSWEPNGDAPALLLVLLRPLQAEFLKFGAKVHEGGGWYQLFEQVERVK